MKKYNKYKPSGIKWIGDIPEQWKFVDLRRITENHKQGYYNAAGYIDMGCKLISVCL